MLFEHFDSQCSLSRDDGLIIKRMDEGKALLLAPAQRLLARLIVVRAGEDHLGAVSARCGHLHQRRRQRHADLRLDAPLGRMIGHSLGVIPRRCRDHAPPALFLRQHQNLVQRAPFLEGAGHLQVFELQENRVPRKLGELLGMAEGSDNNRAPDAVCRILDRANCQHRESPRAAS